jgi:hypothetical protein
MRTTFTASLLAAALACVTGCADAASPESAPDFGKYFTERAQNGTIQARLDGQRLFGPTIDVALSGDGSYVGHLGARVVDLRTEEGKVKGIVGTQPTELYVQPEGEGIRIRGLFAGSLGTLDVTPSVISGTVGRCSYDLKRRGTAAWYSGQKVCGNGRMPQLADLAVPSELDARPPEQKAMLVALFLGAEVG